VGSGEGYLVLGFVAAYFKLNDSRVFNCVGISTPTYCFTNCKSSPQEDLHIFYAQKVEILHAHRKQLTNRHYLSAERRVALNTKSCTTSLLFYCSGDGFSSKESRPPVPTLSTASTTTTARIGCWPARTTTCVPPCGYSPSPCLNSNHNTMISWGFLHCPCENNRLNNKSGLPMLDIEAAHWRPRPLMRPPPPPHTNLTPSRFAPDGRLRG